MPNAYTKVVQCGTLVEEYSYERAPCPPSLLDRKPRKKRPKGLRLGRNARQARKSFFRLVRANLNPKRPPCLLTLTFRDVFDLAVAYKAYTLFFKRMRTLFGLDIRWIGVPEFQKKGRVHFHVLVWGLPDEVIKRERRTRRIANLWGQGFVDIVRTDGDARLSTYLAKYMSKALQDDRLFGKQAYSASRNVLRPVSLTTPFQIETAYNVWGIGVDNPPLLQREYATLFLGRCIYKQFLVDIPI